MIVSVSRRTDVPAYYSEWFFRRLRAGYACVRNPMNPRQISQVSLLPEAVDGFVFWTKNPTPMLDRLTALADYAYYFQYTLTPYGRDVEANLPDKRTVLCDAFCRLSDATTPSQVIWRYDPVILTPKHSLQWHIDQFGALAQRLDGYTQKCTFSFLDMYRKIEAPMRGLDARAVSLEDMNVLAAAFARIAEIGRASCRERV